MIITGLIIIILVGALIYGVVHAHEVAEAEAADRRAARHAAEQERRNILLEKYDDPEAVEMIMQGKFWQGATEEQVRDALGSPVDIDENVYKTKTKTVWKYQQKTKTQFGLKITFENGVIVGWDQK